MNDIDSNDSYLGVLLEEIRDQNKAVLEAVGGIQQKVDNQPTRDEFNELKGDVKVIRVAVTDQSNQLRDHESRIGRPEAKTA
jgi:hypothetical protein